MKQVKTNRLTTNRLKITSGAKWESIVGYSRAIRTGPRVYVSGTTATDETGAIVGLKDPYRQTMQAIENIKRALEQANCSLDHVVRTRIFVTNIGDWEEIARAHKSYFDEIRPASTMVEVSKFISPDMLVEIEADAYIDDSNIEEPAN